LVSCFTVLGPYLSFSLSRIHLGSIYFMTVTLDLRHWESHYKFMVHVYLKYYCLPPYLYFSPVSTFFMRCYICVNHRNMVNRAHSVTFFLIWSDDDLLLCANSDLMIHLNMY
jgi:hypothetical protein